MNGLPKSTDTKWNIKLQRYCNTAEEPQYRSAEEVQYRSAEEPQHRSTEEPQFLKERKVKESTNTSMCKLDLNEPFNRFRKAYTKRQAKQEVIKVFRKMNPDDTQHYHHCWI